MNRTIIYARVSTADQNVLQQARYVANWCKNNKIDYDAVVMDKESGTLPLFERKQFKKLIEEKSTIIVQNLDRFSRNWFDENYLEAHFVDNWENCKLISTGESIDLSNANGKLMFRMMFAINCNRPEIDREKQLIGIRRAIREGKYKGRKKGSKNRK